MFAGFGWGWHHWGADWHRHDLTFDHNRYVSHSSTFINRHDFGVSWNSMLDRGGVVVGEEVEITLDAEAILDE